MPIAGGGDWQCLSGQDPLPRRSPHLGTLRRVGWGAEGFGTFWLMEGPDAMWPTSQSITACVEAGSRGSGGRNFSLGRHGSRCAPVIHAYHLRRPHHLPKLPCPRPLLAASRPSGVGSGSEGVARGTKKFSRRQGHKHTKITSTNKGLRSLSSRLRTAHSRR